MRLFRLNQAMKFSFSFCSLSHGNRLHEKYSKDGVNMHTANKACDRKRGILAQDFREYSKIMKHRPWEVL